MSTVTRKAIIIAEYKRRENGSPYIRFSTPDHPRRSVIREWNYALDSSAQAHNGTLNDPESYAVLKENHALVFIYPLSRSAEISAFFGKKEK